MCLIYLRGLLGTPNTSIKNRFTNWDYVTIKCIICIFKNNKMIPALFHHLKISYQAVSKTEIVRCINFFWNGRKNTEYNCWPYNTVNGRAWFKAVLMYLFITLDIRWSRSRKTQSYPLYWQVPGPEILVIIDRTRLTVNLKQSHY